MHLQPNRKTAASHKKHRKCHDQREDLACRVTTKIEDGDFRGVIKASLENLTKCSVLYLLKFAIPWLHLESSGC